MLVVPAQGERVREALAGTTEEGLCPERTGGQKNLHAGLKSVESAEHTQAMRETKDPLLVKCVCVFAVCHLIYFLTTSMLQQKSDTHCYKMSCR